MQTAEDEIMKVLHLSSAACVPMSDLIWGVVPGWLNEIIFQIRIFSVDCLLLSSEAAWRFEYFPGMERTPRSGDN